MNDHLLTINSNAILSLTSTRPNRIALPYAVSGDIIYHASAILAEHIGATKNYSDTAEGDRQLSKDTTALLDHSTIKATLKILPYRTRLLAGLEITVDLPDGGHLTRKIGGTIETKTVENILDEFFSKGAPGLSDAFHTHWSGTYTAYKIRAGKRPQAITNKGAA